MPQMKLERDCGLLQRRLPTGVTLLALGDVLQQAVDVRCGSFGAETRASTSWAVAAGKGMGGRKDGGEIAGEQALGDQPGQEWARRALFASSFCTGRGRETP